MKRMVFAFYLLFFSAISLSAYELPIVVYPRQIKFNYESGRTNDAIDIRKDYDEEISVPEWVHDGANEKFAYIRNVSDRKIQASIYSNCSPVHLDITIQDITGDSPGEVTLFEADTYTPTAGNYLTIPLEGTVANYVDIKSFTWEWDIEAENTYGVWPYEDSGSAVEYTSHSYYILLEVPHEPMTVPWKIALDFACDWASGKNNEEDIIIALTQNAYNSGRFAYNSTTFWAPDGGPFYLSNMIAFSGLPANCKDMSSMVYVFARTLGCATAKLRQIDGPFNMNASQVKPVSKTWSYVGTFGMHQIVSRISTVYDPTLMLRDSNYENERVPTNEVLDSEYKNDLYLSGTWDVGDPYDYNVSIR